MEKLTLTRNGHNIFVVSGKLKTGTIKNLSFEEFRFKTISVYG